MIYADSLPIMNQTTGNRNFSNNYSYQSPTAAKLTLEQQYSQIANQLMQNQNQPQTSQSNPYTDYLDTFNSCNNIIQHKIQEDSRYQDIYNQCQSALLHEAFSQVMPAVISTQSGRVLFERLNTTTQILKEEYTQAELNREKEIAEREKATEEERKQIESQKQELASMLAQIEALRATIPAMAAQQGYIQPQQVQSTQALQDANIQTSTSQNIVEPVSTSQNNPNSSYNNHSKKNQHHNNYKKSQSGGDVN